MQASSLAASPLPVKASSLAAWKHDDLSAGDVTNVIKIALDYRPGAIAQSLELRMSKYQETAAYCHFGLERYPEDGIKLAVAKSGRSKQARVQLSYAISVSRSPCPSL